MAKYLGMSVIKSAKLEKCRNDRQDYHIKKPVIQTTNQNAFNEISPSERFERHKQYCILFHAPTCTTSSGYFVLHLQTILRHTGASEPVLSRLFIKMARKFVWLSYSQTTPHYSDVIMDAMASQITGNSINCSTNCSGADKKKHQRSASLAFVRGIHRWPVNSPHKWPVTRKCFHLITSSCWAISRSWSLVPS